jgi:DNA-binding NarL/FixJ family response regulator
MMTTPPVDHAPDLLWRVVVCIVDPDLNERLKDGLQSAGYLASSTPSLRSVGEQLAAQEPAVVIFDDRQPDWIRCISDLMLVRPMDRPVVLHSGDNADEFLAALAAGVAGFCAADASLEAVLRTVASVCESGVAIPRRMIAPLVDHVRHGRGHRVQSTAGPIDVTDREWEILQLMVQRRTTREMADGLFVSVGTVRSHVSTLLHKLGAVDRDDAVAMIERARRP